MTLPLDQQNIISSLGLESLADEQKAAIIGKLTTLVEKRVLVRVLDSLQPEQQEEFTKLLEAGDPESISAFLEKNVPTLGAMAEEEVEAVKKDAGSWAETLAHEEA